ERALLDQFFAYPLHALARNVKAVDLGAGEGSLEVSGKEPYPATVIQYLCSPAQIDSPGNVRRLVGRKVIRRLAGDPNILGHQLLVICSHRVKGSQSFSP